MARTKGAYGKGTLEARQAIASFVEGQAWRLTSWLNEVAEGIAHPDKPGEYLVAPNPAKAFEMFQSVVEYHIPKLARTVIEGDPDKPLQTSLTVTFK